MYKDFSYPLLSQASNVYVRGVQGWHLLSRHASAAPAAVGADSSATLH